MNFHYNALAGKLIIARLICAVKSAEGRLVNLSPGWISTLPAIRTFCHSFAVSVDRIITGNADWEDDDNDVSTNPGLIGFKALLWQ